MRWFLLLFLIAFTAFQASAQMCGIERRVTDESPEDDFRRYSESQVQCGVERAAAPYILHAQNAKGTVVLVHGLQGNPALVRGMADQLQKAGYNVVVPILTGHGGADDLLTRSSLEDWKADAHFAGDVAAKMKKPTFMFGYSTGGAIASLEASSRPGFYKAMVGFDPALNLDGPSGGLAKYACIGKNFWTYTSGVPYIFAVKANPSCDNQMHEDEVNRRKREIDALVDQFCAGKVKVPPMNYDVPLQAVCNLTRATDELTPERMKSLPPALTLLSQDPKIFEWINRREVAKTVIRASANNQVLSSGARDHRMMPTPCSQSFGDDMNRSTIWFDKHRGDVAFAMVW